LANRDIPEGHFDLSKIKDTLTLARLFTVLLLDFDNKKKLKF